ncbi:CoA enzyme activase [[Clostridium] sordellii]|uniref:acyl-CoA dehydratase activase n=1 Tax=Paraclostridium sordellii TaxID=1505 RepID=UPI0005E076A1|nr:acyl-CoA dehydratase activase [Paeniclostridium sordellii]MBX9180023.1 2-hydroxyglutaryl-CoA dehydratase [Paeniclostridium sordellii]CEO11156.1 CoA enzyme activase [[Clostridium] sordellii] [Paeniclostridium sordellii]CEP84076.1 CoA enzyme activase [[Clostridium] sordellii] [Paeniclostridium sordellii]
MYSIGIDSGSVATKGVLFDGENIVKKIIIPTGWSPKIASKEVYENLITGIDKENVKKIVGTGYGRVSMDFVDKKVTEITCHAKGVHFLNSNVRTIIDIGGQDSKVINLDNEGNVSNFIMNDKCAAGTGRFLQVTSNLLGTDVDSIDNLANGANPQVISSMCTVFAESEIISLLAKDISKESIAAGILQSIANRSESMLSRIDIVDKVAFTGGVAKSKILVKMLEENLKKDIYISDDTQIIGALGAAIVGYKK